MLKVLLGAAIVCAGAFAGPRARADIALFDFTGVVTTSLLYSGTMQTLVPVNLPAGWSGQRVSGTISVDLGAARHQQYFPGLGMTQVSATTNFPDTDWLQATVHQPDGSTINIASGAATEPYPVLEGNDAYSDIRDSPSQDQFYVQRTFSNVVTYPRQFFSIDLSSMRNSGLTDSADYRNVHFDVANANFSNAGLVTKFDAPGVGYEYGFQVLSLNQSMAAVVPEPSIWALMAVGLAFLGASRLGAGSRHRLKRLTARVSLAATSMAFA